MPNEALIGAVDQLREHYNQRQKATNGLLTALKSSASSLAKSTRALRDYADQNGSANQATLLQSQQAFGELRIKEQAIDPLTPDLRRELKIQQTISSALRDAGAALRAETVDVIKLGRQLLKSTGSLANATALLKAIEGTAAGQTFVDPSVAGKLFTHVANRSVATTTAIADTLSQREREVLRLVAKGLSNTEIAGQLFLSEGTVRNYVSGLFAKLGVNDRTQAAVIALRHGLAD